MVLLPEAASQWAKGAPEKSSAKSALQLGSVQSQSENLTVLSENGNANSCPVQIKVCRDEDGDGAAKQPSYLSLARCISGYTLLTTYDSKQREGFRSRDISPIRVPLPIGMNPPYQTKGQTLEVSGGSKCNTTFTEGDRDDHHRHKSPMRSPLHSATSFFLGSSTMTSTDRILPVSEPKITQTEPKSFVLQRVERLYGPGALAQGFHVRRSTCSTNLPDAGKKNKTITNGNCDNNVNGNTNLNGEDSGLDKTLPVLKLLRPEFRAQLSISVGRHKFRGPSNVDKTDGTSLPRSEHIIPVKLKECDVTAKSIPSPNVIEGEIEQQPIVDQKNGHYYLKIVHKEMASLQRLADDLQSEMNSTTIPDDLEGELRSAVGKARLLVNEKLRQFEGLCRKNISQDAADTFRTTDEDLAGFWDMVFIQVENLYTEFDNIAKLKANGWKQPVSVDSQPMPKINLEERSQVKGTNSVLSNTSDSSYKSRNGSKTGSNMSNLASSKPSSRPPSANNSRDEARRKMLQERKMAMKKNLSAAANQDQVFIS